MLMSRETGATPMPPGQHEFGAHGLLLPTAGPSRWRGHFGTDTSTQSEAVLAHIGLQLMQRVQIVRAMGVDDALGGPGGAGREAQSRGAVLIELTPRHALAQLREEFFIVPGAHARAVRQGGRRSWLFEHDDVLEHRAHRYQLLRQRRQVRTDHEQPVAGLPDHVGQLQARQARVQGVTDDTDAHGPVPALQMRTAVPCHDREVVGVFEAERTQGAGERLAARLQLWVRGARVRVAAATADDAGITVPAGRVLEEVIEREPVRLHGAAQCHLRGARREPSGMGRPQSRY